MSSAYQERLRTASGTQIDTLDLARALARFLPEAVRASTAVPSNPILRARGPKMSYWYCRECRTIYSEGQMLPGWDGWWCANCIWSEVEEVTTPSDPPRRA